MAALRRRAGEGGGGGKLDRAGGCAGCSGSRGGKLNLVGRWAGGPKRPSGKELITLGLLTVFTGAGVSAAAAVPAPDVIAIR